MNVVDYLRERLKGPLPGHDRFLEMSGYRRPGLEQALRQDPTARQSAVLALLYPKGSALHLLLMVRPTYDGVHSGQVSFPGGKQEPDDRDLSHTALREFNEETGGSTADIELLGRLSTVYIPPSRMLVTPFVGYASHVGPWHPDPVEVAKLLEVPLDLVLRNDILKRGEQYIRMLDRSLEVPYFDLHGEVVWGATAMMIAELRDLLGHDAEAFS